MELLFVYTIFSVYPNAYHLTSNKGRDTFIPSWKFKALERNISAGAEHQDGWLYPQSHRCADARSQCTHSSHEMPKALRVRTESNDQVSVRRYTMEPVILTLAHTKSVLINIWREDRIRFRLNSFKLNIQIKDLSLNLHTIRPHGQKAVFSFFSLHFY